MSEQDPMSEPDRQDRIDETLALLGRMTPAAMATNRDELFFRAGEASARGELATAPVLRQRVWPAIAATLAFVAAGFGYSLGNRQPEVQVVYVERPSAKTGNQAAVVVTEAPSIPAYDESVTDVPPALRYARNDIRLGLENDMIHPQDWGALSDAFAQQLQLQHERSAAVRGEDDVRSDPPPGEARTYLEMRDAMRAM